MFLANFVNRFVPKVKADDDIVDPQQVLRDHCKQSGHARHYVERFEECQNRVSSKQRTTETCAEELIDMLHAIDHCVTHDLFSKLK